MILKAVSYGSEELFWVKSDDTGNIYVVKHGEDGWTCTCPFFMYHKVECKHIREVKRRKCKSSQVT